MTKSIFCIMAVIFASPALADGSRFNTIRDGAGYEAGMRKAGVPLSGGMVWPMARNIPQAAPASTVVQPTKAIVKSNTAEKTKKAT